MSTKSTKKYRCQYIPTWCYSQAKKGLKIHKNYCIILN